METTISLKPNELNERILDMLRNLIKTKGFNSITISLSKKKNASSLRKETPKQAKERIDKTIAEIESGTAQLISFTGEEFEAFAKVLSKQ